MRYKNGRTTVHSITLDSQTDQEVKLAETAAERDLLDSLAELYSIIITLDGLEKHYTKDSINEFEYTEICSRLLKQYKSILKDETVSRAFGDLEGFKREWEACVPLQREEAASKVHVLSSIAGSPPCH